jgi:eukaryotic-like serine/threonine-protein kinase
MASSPTASFLEELRQRSLLEPNQLDDVERRLRGKNVEPRAVAQKLVEAGWLTTYQARLALQGRSQELVVGPYVLLEPIGEGGMGQVFKARHTRLARIVALKVIRKDRLQNAKAVRRFQREMETLSKVSHSNIVMAYDAGQAGNTFYIAMEFVDGIDLAKLVKQKGPLPIDKACTWIAQAAMGLQHAHERNLVHRDIKPHNLFLERTSGTVKVLDLGLARIADDDDPSSSMTLEGSVLGTVDFLSPEQAVNAHQADIRADLYSLGCTFYFLLTGQVPFPGNSMTEKMLKHRMDDAVPVEKLRPEVPAAVTAVVRKLMAKQPADRYQTPAEVAAVLAGSTPAGPTTLSPLAPGSQRKKRLLLSALVVGGCVLVLAGVLALRSGNPSGSVSTGPVASGKSTVPTVASKPTEPGKTFANSVGMKLAYLPAGKFLMGSSEEDIILARKGAHGAPTEWIKWESPQHSVTISKPFYMGVYAVTQGQYEKLMGQNPATHKESPDQPVETVDWHDAIEFCRRLSELGDEKKAGRVYRLPTDAEWEYACRAGTTTPFHFGNSLSSLQANFNGEQPFGAAKGPRRGKTMPVGSFQPNAWGLYDMHGNVYQWCMDGPRLYTANSAVDPHGPEGPGAGRVLRGGDWSGPAWVCRSACRAKVREPGKYRTDRSGFRVVCEW